MQTPSQDPRGFLSRNGAAVRCRSRPAILLLILFIQLFSVPATNLAGILHNSGALPHHRIIHSHHRIRLRGGGDGEGKEESEGGDFSVGEPDFSLGGEQTAPEPAEQPGTTVDDDDFSIGTFEDFAPAKGEDKKGAIDGAGSQGVSEEDEDLDLDVFGDVAEIYDEDIDKVVECDFQRIGDTNGVFYHLGSTRSVVAPDEHFQEHPEHRRPPPPARPRFINPGLSGRIQMLTGPLRVMCAERMRGKFVQPEDILERSVVGDEFWIPDGWFAVDLGNHTRLQPSCYLMRNGGGTAEVTTGWILEAANRVEGKWWRVGDWEVIDRHENDTSFLELSEDGSAPGWTDHTRMPHKMDHRTGEEVPAIHPQLQWTWRQEPIGELPHHTLSFNVGATKSYRYFRLRQLTNYMTSHANGPASNRNFYVQGFELYGKLFVDHQQEDMPSFKPLFPRGQWYNGIVNPDFDSEEEPRIEMQWLRGEVDMTEDDKRIRDYQRKYKQQLREMYVDPPPPRTWDKPDYM